jgi:hypothetical protein
MGMGRMAFLNDAERDAKLVRLSVLLAKIYPYLAEHGGADSGRLADEVYREVGIHIAPRRQRFHAGP